MQVAANQNNQKLSPWDRFSIWFNQEHILGPALVAPAVLILVVLIAYPFSVGVWLSFTDKRIGVPDSGVFIGIKNFVTLFHNSIFQRTTLNTFNYAVTAVFFKLALGLLMALVLDQVKIFKNFFRGILLLPWIVPTSLSALGWLWMFDSTYSVFNRILLDWGLIQDKIIWLGRPAIAMFSLQLVNVWRGIPFFGISLLAGMQTIPQELYEAAEIDGASSWHRFWHVTFPLLIPVTAVVTLYSIVQTFADFQVVYVLTRGGPVNSTHLFATLTHQTAILAGELGKGAAVSLFMFPVLVVAVIFLLRYLQQDD